MTDKKLTRTIIILACLIAVVCAWIVFLKIAPGKEPETTAAILTNYDKNEVESIALDTKNDGRLLVYKQGEDWMLEGYDEPINSSIGDTFAAMFARITGVREAADGNADRTEFGLAPAQLTAEVALKDGSTYKVEIGNLSPDFKYRYLTVEGAGNDGQLIYLAAQEAFSFVGDEKATLLRTFERPEENPMVVK